MSTGSEPPREANSDVERFLTEEEGFDGKVLVLVQSLVDEIARTKAQSKHHIFILLFVISVLLVVTLGQHADTKIFWFIIGSEVVFTLNMAKYLDFPWISVLLEQWHVRLLKTYDRYILKSGAEGYEE